MVGRTHKKIISTTALSLLLLPLLAGFGLADGGASIPDYKLLLLHSAIITALLVACIVLILGRERRNKRLLQQNREKELMLENLVKNLPGGVAAYRVGRVNTTLFASEGAAALTGRSVEEFVQWSNGDVIGATAYEDDIPRLRSLIGEAVAAGKPIETSFRIKHKSGRLIWVQLSSVKIREVEGDSIYYAIFSKMPEESVLYKHITDDASTGVYVCDAETLDMIYANDVLQRLLGDSEYKGKKCYEYTSCLKEPCERCLREVMTEKQYATREVYAQRTGNYLANEGHLGVYAGRKVIICYTTDITDIHNQLLKKENQLEDALSMAQSANNAKTEFLSQMSHDMRTPMNAIIGLTTLAKEKVGDPMRMNDYLDKIKSSAGFLLSLVNDCLDMEKIAQGKLTLQPAPYSYRDFAGNLTAMMEPLCVKKGIEFHIQSRTTHNSIVVDKLRFEQIFYILLSNAVKFTPEGGKIELLYRNEHTENDMLTIDYVIKDNGCGMSESFQKRMFLPFEQDERSAQKQQGTGLGLTIVKSIVDKMGGEIFVKSAPGEGTEIIVRLKTPLLPDEAETEEPTAKPEYEKLLAGRRVMLVEDNYINIEVAKALLESKAVEVEVAENGEAALQLFSGREKGHFDAILMDVSMPVMDGLTATRSLRALTREDAQRVPVIAMTANAFAEDVEASLSAGMNAHLSKPIEPELMFETLAKFCS